MSLPSVVLNCRSSCAVPIAALAAADHLQVLDLGVETVEVADERGEEVRRPGRIELLLDALALATERDLADEHADLGLAGGVRHAPGAERDAGNGQGEQRGRRGGGAHHFTSNFRSRSPRSSGLVPSFPSLGSTITFTPRSASAILRPTRFSLPAPCRAVFSSPVPFASASSTSSFPSAARLRSYRSACARSFSTSARPRCSSVSTAGLPLGDDRVALALLDRGLGLGLPQEHRLVLDLPPLDQLLVFLVVDVAPDQHRVDPDAVRRHLVAQLIVRGLRLLDTQRPLIELFAVQLAQGLAQDPIDARDHQPVLERAPRPRLDEHLVRVLDAIKDGDVELHVVPVAGLDLDRRRDPEVLRQLARRVAEVDDLEIAREQVQPLRPRDDQVQARTVALGPNAGAAAVVDLPDPHHVGRHVRRAGRRQDVDREQRPAHHPDHPHPKQALHEAPETAAQLAPVERFARRDEILRHRDGPSPREVPSSGSSSARVTLASSARCRDATSLTMAPNRRAY